MRAGEGRVAELQRRMGDEGIDLFVSNDADSIAYFAEYWNYLGMEFGRATLLLVPRNGAPVLITPAMESDMCRNMTWVEDVRPWADGAAGEWQAPLLEAIGTFRAETVAIEGMKTHPMVLDLLRSRIAAGRLIDAAPVISAMRMIKTADEIAIMRQAGEVAVAMGVGGRDAIGEGVREYEVALAVIAAGTRKAAEFLGADGLDVYQSPMVHNLQILQSGHHTCLVHRRPSVRRIERGEPVYMCFCGIVNFRHFKLGFDREYFVGDVSDEQARVYEATIAAQKAALDEIRPGAIAEDVNTAAEEVYLASGYGASYRTGRGVGYSFLEEPQLKRGDRTVLQAGMTFAVDGGVTLPGEFGGRVGDSIVVTNDGYEFLTDLPRELTVI